MTITISERQATVANLRARGLTQQEVADHLGVAQSVVSRDERAHADRTATVPQPSAPHGGACIDAAVETFFPDTQGASADDALRICLGCPVLKECAEFGLSCGTFNDPSTGVIGGLTANDRREWRTGRATVDQLHAKSRERLGIGDAA